MAIRLIEQTPELTRVALDGRLDTAGVDAVELQFNALVASEPRDTLVDVAAVTFIASMGLRMLITAAKALARRNARMVLFGATGPVADTLALAALDDLMPRAASEEQARALLHA